MERVIELEPFEASKVKVHMPRSERNNKVCAGRIELMVHDVEKPAASTSLVHFGNMTRAFQKLGATLSKKDAFTQSAFMSRSKFSSEPADANWNEIQFEFKKPSEVHQLILSKSGINKMKIEYFDGTAWKKYNNSQTLLVNYSKDSNETKINVDPFIATTVQVLFPANESSTDDMLNGKLDLVVQEKLTDDSENQYPNDPQISQEWCQQDSECRKFHEQLWQMEQHEKDCIIADLQNQIRVLKREAAPNKNRQ